MKKIKLIYLIFLLFLTSCLTFHSQVKKDPSLVFQKGDKIFVEVDKNKHLFINKKYKTQKLDSLTSSIIKDEIEKNIKEYGLTTVSKKSKAKYIFKITTSYIEKKYKVPAGEAAASSSSAVVNNSFLGTQGSSSGSYSKWEAHEKVNYFDEMSLVINRKGSKKELTKASIFPEENNKLIFYDENLIRQMIQNLMDRAIILYR
jgi:hypothetical protein